MCTRSNVRAAGSYLESPKCSQDHKVLLISIRRLRNSSKILTIHSFAKRMTRFKDCKLMHLQLVLLKKQKILILTFNFT